MVFKAISKLPEGYSEGTYRNRSYGITKEIFNGGKSFKVYGKELGGSDFISLNYYCTASGGLLKPCEMSKEKVVTFLRNVQLKID
ncbi:peptide methionine sulfoxide reductase [Flavobacteriaceae bacterium TP-CH-4]|uniref:Peptide methionine sulfoxide reductase n=2 Tax=Pelagihabitans pacificus TaxID=2696054 RepID=A0A967AWN1_9FLAO|nr:peptide methionine sulfoxide reductase [Pelagihabitans pacificus]